MPAIVIAHWMWRWVVLTLALAAIVKAFAGWLGRGPFTPLDRRLSGFYAMSLDIQVLLGLILWIGEQRWEPLLSGAMADSGTRFYAFVHPAVMILALGIAHAGRALSRRVAGAPTVSRAGGGGDAGGAALAVKPAGTSTDAHRNAAIFYLLSLILIIAFIPWNRALT